MLNPKMTLTTVLKESIESIQVDDHNPFSTLMFRLGPIELKNVKALKEESAFCSTETFQSTIVTACSLQNIKFLNPFHSRSIY